MYIMWIFEPPLCSSWILSLATLAGMKRFGHTARKNTQVRISIESVENVFISVDSFSFIVQVPFGKWKFVGLFLSELYFWINTIYGVSFTNLHQKSLPSQLCWLTTWKQGTVTEKKWKKVQLPDFTMKNCCYLNTTYSQKKKTLKNHKTTVKQGMRHTC
jgi:hypothetical protein